MESIQIQQDESLKYFNSQNQTQVTITVSHHQCDYNIYCSNTVDDQEKLILFEAFLKISKLNKEKNR